MKPNPFVIMAEQFDGSGLVFDPETNAAVSINKTGVFLWNLLKDGRSEQEMAAAILERYDGVTPEKADADVKVFLDGLRERSLISDEG
jgi:hypothetical protein